MDRYDPYTDKFIKDATDINVGTTDTISREPLELARAIDGLTEWQKHVQTDSNINRDITIAIEALKAQLGTNLAEVGTRAVRGYPIDADALMEKVAEEYGERARDRLYQIIRYMPPAQPEIIQCKDCKHHWTHKCMDSMPIERCDLEQTFYDAEVDYCSLAERRTDG